MIYYYGMSPDTVDYLTGVPTGEKGIIIITGWRYTFMVQTILNAVLIILIIAAVVLAVLYFLGTKRQKRQLEQ